MKLLIAIILGVLVLPFVLGANQISYNGKTYYVVSSDDVTENTGDKVCSKVGMVCNGYTEPSDAVCKLANPGASSSSSGSGDASGVYCDGAPQNGECSGLSNSCHTCPGCSTSVQCDQEIGGLYREMYVECIKPSSAKPCRISINAQDVNQFMSQIPGINSQFQSCPQQVPRGTGVAIANGNTVVNVGNNKFTLSILGGKVSGIQSGASSICKQTLTISENDFNSILTSSSASQMIASLFAQKKIKLTGCNFGTKLKLFFTKPFIGFFAKKVAPSPPPPKPAPNCGNIGEQCNNRGCFSGICAAPEENINGQWRHVNYRCIDQRDWNTYCQGRGNTPPPWACLTGICR